MSDGLNKVFLVGNVCVTPELRFTQSGQAVLNVRMATNESYVDKDKVRQERVEYHPVVVWGARGEGLAKVLVIGSQIHVEGSLRTSSYEKDGEKRYKTEIHANNVLLLGRKPDAPGDGTDTAPRGDAPPRAQASPGGRGGYGGNAGSAPSTGGVAYPGVKSAGDFEVRFGRDAGKPISLVEDLGWLRGVLVKDIANPEKAQYAERAKGQVNAIDEMIASRKGGGAKASATSEAAEYGGTGFGDDSDLPF